MGRAALFARREGVATRLLVSSRLLAFAPIATRPYKTAAMLLSRAFEEATSDDGPFTWTATLPNIKKPVTLNLWKSKDVPSKPKLNSVHIVIATHGAGGTCLSVAMADLCHGLTRPSTDTGCPQPSTAVLAFDGSMNLKARTDAFLAVIDYACAFGAIGSVSLAGRSMGCRAAATAFVETSQSSKMSGRLILESYPLVGNKEDVRKQPLLDLPDDATVLLIKGSEDDMAPVDKLKEVAFNEMKASAALLVVQGLDHGMLFTAATNLDGNKKDAATRLRVEAAVLASSWLLHSPQGHSQGILVYVDASVKWSGWTTNADVQSPSVTGPSKRRSTSSSMEDGGPRKKKRRVSHLRT